ncbi:MAG: cytochrome P450 [Proteobacteria bacterium]|nr:cytochrome P450 [Pseudomonadota bacterium]
MAEQVEPNPSESGDPFDDFNRAQGAGTVRTPYPMFAELRAQGPVVKIKPSQFMGAQAPDVDESLLPDLYSAVSHDAVSEILRDGKRFSSKGYALTMGPVMGHSILEMDEPEHSRYRGLIQMAFSKKALERWEHELVGPVIHGLIDRFAERGHADLVRELTFPFPVSVIAGMIGLPKEDHDDFHRWAVELISVGFDLQRGMAASQKLRDLFARVLALRREDPQDDLMSVLAHSDLDGTVLDDEAIFAFLRLLAPAGAETTYRSSSNLLCGLFTYPNQLEALRADRGLMDAAIEEGLRWECPLTGILRTASEATEVCGVPLPAGAMIYINMGAANHDETRYERAEEFDIFRPARQHMAFAFGPHRCLGMHLARMETRLVVNAVLDRLPNVRLDPSAEDVHITGMIFRSPLSLPVVFDPTG